MNQITAFLAISLLVIVTPGQDTALTIRNTMLGGRRAGVFTALGVFAGQVFWTLAAIAGVAALLQASEPAFVTLRFAGAAYLVYLGLQALWSSVHGGSHPHADAPPAWLARRQAPWVASRQGLMSNLGNPKMAIFFTSMLPQFGSSFLVVLPLGLAFCSLTLCWLTCYAIVVARAGKIVRRPQVRRLLDGLTGTVLVLFGLRLAGGER